nr:hypothetical protein [Mucilaginibacter sp. FT3.2]
MLIGQTGNCIDQQVNSRDGFTHELGGANLTPTKAEGPWFAIRQFAPNRYQFYFLFYSIQSKPINPQYEKNPFKL